MTNKEIKQTNTFIITPKSVVIKKTSPLSFCQKKTIKNNIRKRNPNIFEFSIDSKFIYEPILSINFYANLENKNLIKPSQDEIIFLKNLIH